MYRSRGSYNVSLDLTELRDNPVIGFMINFMTLGRKPVLSHKWKPSQRNDIPLNKDTIQALKDGYTDSLNLLKNHLEEVDPTLKKIFKN